MRLAVTGRQGQIVQNICQKGALAGVEVITLGRPEVDLASPVGLGATIKSARPDILLSAAAFTAVDKAESERDLALRINGEAPGAIAAAAADLGIPIIHISTDYVFDGTKTSPYIESDPTGPVNHYGVTKLAGEQAVANATPNHAIVRTSWVYSETGSNFVKTMLRLSETRDRLQVVADQVGQPSYAADVADALVIMARRLCATEDAALRGIFHLAGTGVTHWAGFASKIFSYAGRATQVDPIPTSQFPTPARRPANSRMDCTKLQLCYDIQMPLWTESLRTCVHNLTGNRQ